MVGWAIRLWLMVAIFYSAFSSVNGWLETFGFFLIIGGLAYLALEPYRIKNAAVAEKIRKMPKH